MNHIADRTAIRPKPHHYMNADGTCHAGDIFEAGTGFIVLYSAEELVRIVNHEKAVAWQEGLDAYDDAFDQRTANPYAAHRES